jgi:hypothetical protein
MQLRTRQLLSDVGHYVHRVRPLKTMSKMESSECSTSTGTSYLSKKKEKKNEDIRCGYLWPCGLCRYKQEFVDIINNPTRLAGQPAPTHSN